MHAQHGVQDVARYEGAQGLDDGVGVEKLQHDGADRGGNRAGNEQCGKAFPIDALNVRENEGPAGEGAEGGGDGLDGVEDGGMGDPRDLSQGADGDDGEAEAGEGLDEGGEAHADGYCEMRAGDEGGEKGGEVGMERESGKVAGIFGRAV